MYTSLQDIAVSESLSDQGIVALALHTRIAYHTMSNSSWKPSHQAILGVGRNKRGCLGLVGLRLVRCGFVILYADSRKGCRGYLHVSNTQTYLSSGL